MAEHRSKKRWLIASFTIFHTSEMVQDLCHQAYDGRLQKHCFFLDFFLYIPYLQSRRNHPNLTYPQVDQSKAFQCFQEIPGKRCKDITSSCNFQNLSIHFGAIPLFAKNSKGNMFNQIIRKMISKSEV